MSPTEILVVEAVPEAFGEEWDALADAVGAPPWWRPGWVDAWSRAFGTGSLTIVAVRRDGALVGVLPLHRVGADLRSTTNYHTPSFGLLAVDDQARHELAATALAHAGRRLSIAFLPEDGRSLQALEAVAGGAGGGRWHRRVLEHCPYLVTDGTSGAAPALRGHLVRELRRRERRLAGRGDLAFEVHDGRTDLAGLLADGFAVEAAGWKGARGSAIASRPATSAFYAAVASFLAARGSLRLAFLRLDGRPFAFDFAVEEAGVHSLLKTGYDPAFRADGPGMLLRARMIERAYASDIVRYDFLGRDDPWKREWTTLVEDQILFQAFRGPLAIADWAAQRYLRPAARRVVRR